MTRTRPPVWFWIVAILLLLWGLSGVFACVQQWRLGPEAMGPATNYDQILYARIPGWYNPVYAVATVGGMLAGKGPANVLPFPIFIAAVAAFGIWLSRLARRRGWIG